MRILWNLLIFTDEEGRNDHVSRETLTAHWFTHRPGHLAGFSLYSVSTLE